MRVFRRRHTLGCVALLAFAMQAVLAFAHTHAHSFPVAGAQDLAARAMTYGMCRASAERPCPAPTRHNDHTKCPICWSTSLASAAVLHAPLAVTPQHLPGPARVPVPAAALPHGGGTVPFQARAPPACA